MRDLTWSPVEKSIARRAFNKALDSELEEVIRKTKRMAGNIKEAADLWKLEKYLTHARNEIDEKYDYRYSVLPIVFGRSAQPGKLRWLR